MNDNFENIFIIAAGALVAFFIGSWLVFFVGYISGIIAKLVIGEPLIQGINMIFKTNLTKDALPLITGTIAWISAFFKTSTINTQSLV